MPLVQESPLSRSVAGRRAGMSVFHVLTIVFAIGGGVWLGAQYMGVKLTDVAYTALDETQMLDKVPEGWRPELSDCPVGDCVEKTAPDVQTAELKAELANLRLEVATLRKAAALGKAPGPMAAAGGADAEQREQTLAYWARLCEIANEVAALDRDLEPATSEDNTGHVFDIRRRAFEYGRRSIESIDLTDVDPKAAEGGNRLIGWYEQSSGFYQQATSVWDGMAGGKRLPHAEAALEKSRLQQEKQTELLRSKLAELSRLLSRRYAAVLPAIGV